MKLKVSIELKSNSSFFRNSWKIRWIYFHSQMGWANSIQTLHFGDIGSPLISFVTVLVVAAWALRLIWGSSLLQAIWLWSLFIGPKRCKRDFISSWSLGGTRGRVHFSLAVQPVLTAPGKGRSFIYLQTCFIHYAPQLPSVLINQWYSCYWPTLSTKLETGFGSICLFS
jgi:hypothetical protein